MGIVARHADVWNNMAVAQAQLGSKVEALKRRCDEEKRDFGELLVSQQCVVVIGETEDEARTALAKAQKIYGGHMGAGLEEHGIWGTPARVVECIERHRALGLREPGDRVLRAGHPDPGPPLRRQGSCRRSHDPAPTGNRAAQGV